MRPSRSAPDTGCGVPEVADKAASPGVGRPSTLLISPPRKTTSSAPSIVRTLPPSVTGAKSGSTAPLPDSPTRARLARGRPPTLWIRPPTVARRWAPTLVQRSTAGIEARESLARLTGDDIEVASRVDLVASNEQSFDRTRGTEIERRRRPAIHLPVRQQTRESPARLSGHLRVETGHVNAPGRIDRQRGHASSDVGAPIWVDRASRQQAREAAPRQSADVREVAANDASAVRGVDHGFNTARRPQVEIGLRQWRRGLGMSRTGQGEQAPQHKPTRHLRFLA